MSENTSSIALITGATGFIGSHLALRLVNQGRKVRVLCRPESIQKLHPEIGQKAEIAQGDLKDPASLKRAVQGAQHVFHCAGQVADWGADAEFNAANVQGTADLLKSAAQAQVQRFVHLSSIAVFGVPSPERFDDNTPYGAGMDPYSRTKIEGEKLALRAFQEIKLPVTVLRPAVVYGPRSTWLEEPLRMIRSGKMFLLDRGRGTCHPCYIENLIDAMILATEHPKAVGQAFIVGDDDPITFAHYFQGVASLAGQGPIQRSIPLSVARAMASTFETTARLTRTKSRPLLTHTAIDMVCTRSQMSMEKLRNELGYRPRYRFDQAIQELQSIYLPTKTLAENFKPNENRGLQENVPHLN
jgi:nucleoside-diphosphate-sugar epimerase